MLWPFIQNEKLIFAVKLMSYEQFHFENASQCGRCWFPILASGFHPSGCLFSRKCCGCIRWETELFDNYFNYFNAFWKFIAILVWWKRFGTAWPTTQSKPIENCNQMANVSRMSSSNSAEVLNLIFISQPGIRRQSNASNAIHCVNFQWDKTATNSFQQSSGWITPRMTT